MSNNGIDRVQNSAWGPGTIKLNEPRTVTPGTSPRARIVSNQVYEGRSCHRHTDTKANCHGRWKECWRSVQGYITFRTWGRSPVAEEGISRRGFTHLPRQQTQPEGEACGWEMRGEQAVCHYTSFVNAQSSCGPNTERVLLTAIRLQFSMF